MTDCTLCWATQANLCNKRQPQPPPLRSGKHTTIAQQESGRRLSCVRSLVQSQLVAPKAAIPRRQTGNEKMNKSKAFRGLPFARQSLFSWPGR